MSGMLDEARGMARRRHLRRVGTRCAGLDTDELHKQVEAAMAPESLPVLEELNSQVEEYYNKQVEAGIAEPRPHGFVEWICALQAGWATLPTIIPQSVMLAWRDGYKSKPAGCPPHPFWRCEDCHMALPDVADAGTPANCHYPTSCPVCGSRKLFHMNIARPWGTAWIDPAIGRA
jgi:hypothetical protein